MNEIKDDASLTRFNYKLVSVGLGTNSIILVDVRDISKRLTYGRIPGSLHVPSKFYSNWLSSFKLKYLSVSCGLKYEYFVQQILVKEIPIAFNYSAATSKEFEGEYDFKRPPKKEKERKKTIVFVSDSITYASVNQGLEANNGSEDQV